MTKQGGSAAYDSDVYSIQGYSTCHLSFKLDNLSSHMMAGFNTDPTTDQSYTSIDYAWHCSTVAAGGDGHWYTFVSGTGTDSGITAAVTDLAEMTYDGSNVRFYINKQLIRTIAIASQTFFFDSSFYSVGAGINSVNFGPTTTLAVVDTSGIGTDAATELEHQYTAGPISSTHYNTAVSFHNFALGTMSASGLLVVTCGFDAYHTGGGSGDLNITATGSTGGTITGSVVRVADDGFYPSAESYILRAYVPINFGDNVTLSLVSTHKGISATPPGLTATTTINDVDWEVEFIKR
jgi:hypothetical protein